jgi:molybdate transport system substrate-binding protein
MGRRSRAILAAFCLLTSSTSALAKETVRLHAAGSLRGALSEVAETFTRASRIGVKTEFGASGTLRERLEAGEPGDVFASANMEHPLTLARHGKAGPAVLFARNELAAYGLTVLTTAHPERAMKLAMFILSPEGESILARYGFTAAISPGR